MRQAGYRRAEHKRGRRSGTRARSPEQVVPIPAGIAPSGLIVPSAAEIAKVLRGN